MSRHIHIHIDDPAKAKELEAIRHIERTIKPLQDRIKKFKEWADEEASRAAEELEHGTVVTLEICGPKTSVTAVGTRRTKFDRKRLFAEHPDHAEKYSSETVFWRKQL